MGGGVPVESDGQSDALGQAPLSRAGVKTEGDEWRQPSDVRRQTYEQTAEQTQLRDAVSTLMSELGIQPPHFSSVLTPASVINPCPRAVRSSSPIALHSVRQTRKVEIPNLDRRHHDVPSGLRTGDAYGLAERVEVVQYEQR